MTYTERLNILAEKMALVKYPTRIENDRVWNSVVADFVPLAEIALQHTAELTEQAYIDGYSDCTNSTTGGIDAAEYINSLGLVSTS